MACGACSPWPSQEANTQAAAGAAATLPPFPRCAAASGGSRYSTAREAGEGPSLQCREGEERARVAQQSPPDVRQRSQQGLNHKESRHSQGSASTRLLLWIGTHPFPRTPHT